MKILQINNVYGVGSTGKLTKAIHQGLMSDGYSSVVIYGRGASEEDKNLYRVCGNLYGKFNSFISRLCGIPYGGCFISTIKIISIIKKEKPDVVHIQCINGNFVNIYRLIKWLNDNRIAVVLTLHAEFMYTANCGHSLECNRWLNGCSMCPDPYYADKSYFFDRTHDSFIRMKRAFSGFNDRLRVVSVSPWLMCRAKQSPILKDKIHSVILNAVDTSVFYYRNNKKRVYEYLASAEKDGIVFHATAMFRDTPDDIKGGEYVLKLAERMTEFIFIVAGKYKLSWSAPDNVFFLGEVQDQRLLAELYSAADITVISSKRETFSMICAESLCCGTPVAGFRAGGPEQISMKEFSSFVSYGDVDELERAARELIKLKRRVSPELISEKAHKVYSQKSMLLQYEQIYRGLQCEQRK